MSAETVLSSLIAVAGALGGSSLTSWWHGRSTRAERRDRNAQAHRDALITAVADLVAALDAHRTAMWTRETTRLSGASAQDVAATIERSHQTRAAVSAPLARVRILAPTLADAATKATKATYGMHDAADDEFLAQQRVASIDAVAALEAAVSALVQEVTR